MTLQKTDQEIEEQKILILPKIDQFYKMIEDEMKNMSEGQPQETPTENSGKHA